MVRNAIKIGTAHASKSDTGSHFPKSLLLRTLEAPHWVHDPRQSNGNARSKGGVCLAGPSQGLHKKARARAVSPTSLTPPRCRSPSRGWGLGPATTAAAPRGTRPSPLTAMPRTTAEPTRTPARARHSRWWRRELTLRPTPGRAQGVPAAAWPAGQGTLRAGVGGGWVVVVVGREGGCLRGKGTHE